MNTNKRIKVISLSILISLIIIGAIILGSCVLKNNTVKDKVYMNASWGYNYSDIEELTSVSDLIAFVKVNSISKEYIDQGTPFTEYVVDVITPVLNTQKGDSLIIRLTGGPNDDVIFEIEDAPLLKSGEELMIFCQENTVGSYPSYTIISGAQGRLYYSNGKLNSLCMIDENVMQANSATNIKIKDADFDEMVTQIHSYIDKQ